jgi:uncharacterized protein (TIGR02145 family)/uncharacterized repeat protein (TIGR02543 family)
MDGNKTLVAVFEQEIYTLTTGADPTAGGSVSRLPNKTTYNYGEQVTVTATAASGYIFKNWSGASTATTNQISITMDDNKTLTASFERAAYTITFDANGGSVSPTSGATGTDGKLASLPTPTRTGYAFNGWFTETTGGTQVTTSTVFSVNATIYAQWGGATFTDSRDNKSYKRVQIGSQVWMAENLNYDVPNNTSDVCYDNDDANCAQYGRLYNWSTAMNGASSSRLSPSGVQGVCPAGWHLPSNAEWTALEDAVGGVSTTGTKLKSTSGWFNNGNGTDQYGWSALPAGHGSSDGSFYAAGYNGNWWSATENNAGRAYNRYMNYDYEGVGWGDDGKTNLFSVRCVQD